MPKPKSKPINIQYYLSDGRSKGRHHDGYLIVYQDKKELERLDVEGANEIYLFANELEKKYRQLNCQVIRQNI